jgi:hypothetical protein
VEDELHFVIKCQKFQNPNLDELSNDQLFVFLMSAEDDIILHVLGGLQNVNVPEKRTNA